MNSMLLTCNGFWLNLLIDLFTMILCSNNNYLLIYLSLLLLTGGIDPESGILDQLCPRFFFPVIVRCYSFFWYLSSIFGDINPLVCLVLTYFDDLELKLALWYSLIIYSMYVLSTSSIDFGFPCQLKEGWSSNIVVYCW